MNENTNYIIIDHYQKLLYIVGYMHRVNIRIKGLPKYNDDRSKWQKRINDTVDEYCENQNKDKSDFIKEIISSFEKEFFFLTDFDFIKDNDIFCMFAWLFICQCNFHEEQIINKTVKKHYITLYIYLINHKNT